MADDELITTLAAEGPIAPDSSSISTYHTATSKTRANSFEKKHSFESTDIPEYDEDFPLREMHPETDDLDFEEHPDDGYLPHLPLPDLPAPEPPHASLFQEMRADGGAAICAGVEFIQETTLRAQRILQRVWKATWIQTPFHHLPDWLKDNDFLTAGHRPQIESFRECFRSIFRIHTETGNIWTHLLGCVAFIGTAVYFLQSDKFSSDEKWVFSAFFAGAVVCMGFSFMFHTLYCHSRRVGMLFLKLDYCGIAILIFGSFVPWLHFGFYCRTTAKIVYISVIGVLTVAAVVVSLWSRFSKPHFRPIRAAVFVSLGLIGLVPAAHSLIAVGWWKSMQETSIHWLFLMGFLYILGATLYAFRIPERLFPGRFDIWFQSHQIFHVFVVIAAFVHYHGISAMASYRLTVGACPNLPPVLESVALHESASA